MSELSYSYSEMLGGVGGTTAHTGFGELESSNHRRGSYLKNTTHAAIIEEDSNEGGAKKSLAEIFRERKGQAVVEDRPRTIDNEFKKEKTKEELAEIRKQMMKRP